MSTRPLREILREQLLAKVAAMIAARGTPAYATAVDAVCAAEFACQRNNDTRGCLLACGGVVTITHLDQEIEAHVDQARLKDLN